MSQEKVTQQEIQDCIKAGHKAGLQNSEQLCVLGIIRRFPQLCLWYADSENENRKLKRELNAAKAEIARLTEVAAEHITRYNETSIESEGFAKLKKERDAANEKIKNNPWCAACKERKVAQSRG